jgi:[acyl-carrier-protein] S-malonyltransferase
MGIAYAFPGQGAQKPGMGRSLFEAFPESRAIFERASEVLSFDLTRLCFDGPAEELTSTDIAQPAILTTSVAALEALRARGLPPPTVALGHSLGEYSALVAVGAITFEEALRLVRRRGLYMRQAAQEVGGAMAAVVGAGPDAIDQVLTDVARGRVLVAANRNAPDQVVISGEQAAVSEAADELKGRAKARVVLLRVSGAFHSPLMQAAADRLGPDLDAAAIGDAAIPVIANVSAAPVTAAGDIRAALREQIIAGVRWSESVERLRGLGCEVVVEMGSRDILGAMIRKTDPELRTFSAHDAESVEATLSEIGHER